MKEYKFKTEDFIQLENLIKLTKAIEKIYLKLYDMEINCQKNTDEYKKLLEELELILALEEKEYKSYNLNYSKCVTWINYLLLKKVPKDFISNIHSVMIQDYDYAYIRRILRILTIKMESDKESLKEILPKKILDLVEQFDEEEANNILSIALNSSIELENAFENDILNSYLMILQDVINSNSVKFLNDRLIKSKYNLMYINPNIEKNIISNNLEIPKDIFINSRFVADLAQIDLNSYNFLKNTYATKIFSNNVIEILNIKDIDYNDKIKSSSSILRQCLIRATLLMMTNDAVTISNDSLKEYLESDEYKNSFSDNKISEQISLSSFNQINKDKEKIKTISLGNRKY